MMNYARYGTLSLNREGYDVENAELSMRLYDDELTENVEYDMGTT